MFRFIRIKLNERAVVFQNGLPKKALAPGRHVLIGFNYTEQCWCTEELVFGAPLAVRAILPSDWFAEVKIGAKQRGVLFVEGHPWVFLRPGTHRYWTVDPSVELRIYSVDEPMPEMTDELAEVIPKKEWVELVVTEHEKGLLYVKGRLERTLEPGRYAFWTHPEAPVVTAKIDMRRFEVAIAGQELMTRDKVTLRLTLSVEYAVEDAALATTRVASVRDALYLAVQLAARDFVAGVTLDELLEGRDAMTKYLESKVVPQAVRFGVRVEAVGIKDVVLTGEM